MTWKISVPQREGTEKWMDELKIYFYLINAHSCLNGPMPSFKKTLPPPPPPPFTSPSRVSLLLYIPGWPRICCVDQAGFEPTTTHLPQSEHSIPSSRHCKVCLP